MDYKKIDKIVGDFVENPNYKVVIKNLPKIIELSKSIYNEQNIDFNYPFEKVFDINESLDLIYDFLKTIDLDIAQQYLNLIYSKDSDGKPYVNFVLSTVEDATFRSEVDDKGYVHIYYSPNLFGTTTILHELLHKMNHYIDIEDGNRKVTFTRLYFSETVSILGEMMFSDYLLEKGIISQRDYDKLRAIRLDDSKKCSKTCLIENELIKLKQEGKDINLENLQSLVNNYDSDSIEHEIYEEERQNNRRLNYINDNDMLRIDLEERYIIAEYFYKKIIKKEDAVELFKYLHYEVGNTRSDYRKVYNTLTEEIGKGR